MKTEHASPSNDRIDVVFQMDRLGSEVEKCHILVSQLIEAVDPILSPANEMEDEPRSCYSSSLGGEIAVKSDHLRAINRNLQDIINRIDLGGKR